MTEVSVVFPSRGGIDVQNRETVEGSQEVTWKIQSFNTDVTGVKITFDDGDPFFEDRDGNPSNVSPERKLIYSGPDGKEFATATIYGRAPQVDNRTAKYTVTGIGGRDTELDPEIVIIKTPGG